VVNAAAAPAAPPVPAAPPAAAAAPNVTHSLAALANATETLPDKKPVAPAGPVDIAERQRKEPRLAVPAQQPVAKVEPKSEMGVDDQKAAAGDGSQRPQRWGFWRGNR